MPEISDETKNLVEEFQNYQQQLQSLMMQKETLKLQNIEIERAVEELDTTKEKKAYKITGNVMISKPVEELKKELNETKEAIEIKLKSYEKMEEKFNSRLKELQTKLKDVMK
ncbi:MAG: prefoldin subunit [Candidatus Aenigmarchaeota archaeon]|nr:prefoldin subunit [Candidatus Aenigmarchaeota archaeon]